MATFRDLINDDKDLKEDFDNRKYISGMILKKFVERNKIYNEEHLGEQITLCNLDEWKDETPEFISGLMILKNDWKIWKGVMKPEIENLEFAPMPKDKFLFQEFGNFTDYLETARRFVNRQPVYFDIGKNWWLWNYQDFKWERIDETDLMVALDRHTKNPSVNNKVKQEIIESLRRIGRERKPREVPPTWIQFKDIIFDIKTGEERRASPEYFVTNPIPWKLHKERYVVTPVMDRIFEEWVGPKYVQTLYEIMAYCLIPSYPLHRIFCLIGGGLNGKSKFLELLRLFIGDENCCATELDTLLNSRFEITRLHKKLVCQMGETNFNEMSKTSTLKKLSGDDLIGFEYKNKDLIHEKNYAKIIIATNNLPTTTDKTVGFYRRWLIVDFPNQFSEKKDILADIPKEEYEILSVKLLGVLKNLLDKKEFHNEGSVEDRMKRYEEKSNFLNKFVSEYLEREDSQFVTKNSFYKRFIGWCKENKHRELSEVKLARQMKEIGIESDRDSIEWEEFGKLTKRQVRVWRGLKWKNSLKE